MNPARFDVTFVPGDDLCETLTIVDENTGANFNTTGFTGTFVVRTAVNDATALMTLTEVAGITFGDGTIILDSTNAVGGEVDTSGWDAYEKLAYSLRVTDSSGCEDTYLYGFLIIEDVA